MPPTLHFSPTALEGLGGGPSWPPAGVLRPAKSKSRAARGLLALLLCAWLGSCVTYESQVLNVTELPEELLREGERAEVPGSRRTSLRARLEMDGPAERLIIEEVVLCDFQTEREVAARREEERRARVRSEMLGINDGYNAYWFFPHSSTYIGSNDDLAIGFVSYLFALPIVTWTDLVADVVTLPYHTLQMFVNERDRVVSEDAVVRLDLEQDVVLEVRQLDTRVEAVRVHLGDESTLLPEDASDASLRLTASELLALDRPITDALEVSFLHDGVARRLPIELPEAWQARRRAEFGFDANALAGRGLPNANVTIHLPEQLPAGDAAFFAIDVANSGTGDFVDLVAELRSPHPHLNGRQLPLGRLRPGENANALVRLHVPRNDAGGLQRLGVVFRHRSQSEIDAEMRELVILPRPAPQLVASLEPVIVLPAVDPVREAARALVQQADGGTPNDSAQNTGTQDAAAAAPLAPLVAPLSAAQAPWLVTGEVVRLRAHVRNVGSGDARDAFLELAAPHPALHVPGEELALGDILPGESVSVDFDVQLDKDLRAMTAPLLISTFESGLGARTWQDLSLPLDRALSSLPGQLDPPVALAANPGGLLARMAGLAPDEHLFATEILADRWRVMLPDGRLGWVGDDVVGLVGQTMPRLTAEDEASRHERRPAADRPPKRAAGQAGNAGNAGDAASRLDTTPPASSVTPPGPSATRPPATQTSTESAKQTLPDWMLDAPAEQPARSTMREQPPISDPFQATADEMSRRGVTPSDPPPLRKPDAAPEAATSMSPTDTASTRARPRAKPESSPRQAAESSPRKTNREESSGQRGNRDAAPATNAATNAPNAVSATGAATATSTAADAADAKQAKDEATRQAAVLMFPTDANRRMPDVGDQVLFPGTQGHMPDDRTAVIQLERPLPRRVEQEHVRIALSARDDHGLKAVSVSLNGRASRLLSGDTRGEDERALSRRVVASLALRPGLNRVEIIASDGVNPDNIIEHTIHREKVLGHPWLLVVGTDRTLDPAIPDLDSAQTDARALGEALGELMQVPAERRLALLGREATRDALWEMLDSLGRLLDEEDELILVFAGHGDARSEEGSLALVPFDAALHAEDEHLWSVAELGARLAQLPSQQMLLVLDAGFRKGSGRGLGDASNPSDFTSALEQLTQRPGLLALTAAEINQPAPEDAHGGVLTTTLLDLLGGNGDTNADGVMGARELYAALCRELEDAGSTQRPLLLGDPAADILLLGRAPTP